MKTINRIIDLVSFLVLLLVVAHEVNAAQSPSIVRRISNKYGCALYGSKGSFKLGTLKTSGKFTLIKASKISSDKKLKKAEKVCKKIKGTGVVYSSLPSASAMTLSATTSGFSSRTTSGTPPTLASLASGGGAALFWRTGVLTRLSTNSATSEDCSEFYGNVNEGRSGGHTLCTFVDGLNQTLFLSKRLEANTCYVKTLISSTTMGGIARLVSGRLPDGSVDLLFDTPSGSTPRTVKVQLAESGIEVFVRINSASQNRASGNDYSSETWYCGNGSLTGYESSSVRSLDRLYTVTSKMTGLNLSMSGNLTISGGRVVVDSASMRNISVLSDMAGTLYKTSMNIQPGNIFEQKLSSLIAGKTQKIHSMASLTGSSDTEIRLIDQASKFQIANSLSTIATGQAYSEFRDTSYISSALTPYTGISTSDFSTDPFFTSGLATDFNSSSYACDTVADVTISLAITDPTALAIAGSCLPVPSSISTVCQAQDIITSELNFRAQCVS